MSCDSEFRNFEASCNSNVINGGYHEDSRISYTRESLLFLDKLDASKTLPSEFDCSIFSELNDACKSSPDDHKSPRLEWTGRISGESSRDSVERWHFCKLSSKESRSIDSEKPISNQSQHSWQNPGNNDSVGSLQNTERNGILRSFSKQSYVGSEVSTSKLQGTDTCQLSRCNHPYRPPSFYKAMNHPGANNHDHSSKETSAECPSKERLMEGSWRKDTCVGLEENSSALSCNDNPPLLSPADNGSIELPCSSGKAPENHLTEEYSVSCPLMQDPVMQQLSSQCQLVLVNSGMVIDDAVEELQGQILDGGRFSALISLEEVEDVDAYFLDEANIASNDCSRDGQNVKQGNVEFKYTEKKELRSHAVNSTKREDSKDHEDTLVNALGKTACNISAVGLSRSSSYVTPYKASNSQLAFESKDWKCIDTAAKDLHKTYDPPTQGSDCSEVRAPQLPPYTKKNDNIVNGKGSCRSGSRFIHWFPDNDDSKFNISSEVNEEGWVVWGETTGKSKKEKLSGQGLLQEASTYCKNDALCKKTSSDVPEVYSAGIISQSQNLQVHKLDNTDGNKDLDLLPGEAYGLQIAEEADACLDFNLPDEDSLITFDDTYIWDQDASKPSCGILSPVSGSNKSMRLENVQSLSLAHPWFHESEMNTRSPLVNPSNSMPHVKTLSGFHDPWEHSTNDCTPTLSVASPHSLPLKPRKHEPSDNCCPDLDNILSADPSMYHQFLQTPCRNQDPCMLINFPLNQATAKSMDVEIRGLLADKSNNSTVSQFLQMQRMLAQLNIEAIEQRVYQTSSHLFHWVLAAPAPELLRQALIIRAPLTYAALVASRNKKEATYHDFTPAL